MLSKPVSACCVTLNNLRFLAQHIVSGSHIRLTQPVWVTSDNLIGYPSELEDESDAPQNRESRYTTGDRRGTTTVHSSVPLVGFQPELTC